MTAPMARAESLGREMGQATTVEAQVGEALRSRGALTMEALTRSLPQASWTQVFLAVDRLSRAGRVVLRRTHSGDYQVSLAGVPV